MTDDPNFTDKRPKIARTIMGPKGAIYDNGNTVVFKPIQQCTIITVSGQIWDGYFDLFTVNEDKVKATWDTNPSFFIKRVFEKKEI